MTMIVRMKIAVCLSFFLLLSSSLDAQSEQLVIRLSKPGQPGFLSFDNPKGSVKVTGYDGDVVLINAVLRYTGKTAPSGNGMRKIEQKAFDISADEKNNNISLICISESKTVDFDIKIPRRFSLKISSFDNGKIEIIRVAGSIEADNPNGDILLDNISGSAVLNSVNGRIRASFASVDASSPMMFTSLEGNIELTLPAKVNADIKLRSQHGEVYSDFNIKPVRRQTEVQKGNQGGHYALEDWTVGLINNGGPQYFISTYNGNIYLRKSKTSL
jgi:hypothetical protein